MAARTREPKSLLMSLALFGTGVVEAVEQVEKGRPLLSALGDAVENTRIRGRAIKRAGKAAARQIRAKDSGDDE